MYRRYGRLRWAIQKQGVLLGMLGVLAGVFVAQEVLGPGWYGGWMAVPAEVGEAWGRVRGGGWGFGEVKTLLTLLTAALLHADIGHLAFNAVFLWIFAAVAVDLLGQGWMVGLFLVTAVAGSLCHVLLNAGSEVPMLGVSGAVMGFEGAYLGLAARWHLPEAHVWPMTRPMRAEQLGLVAVIGIVFDYTGLLGGGGGGTAYGAHIGGFTAGLFLTALAAPKPTAARAR